MTISATYAPDTYAGNGVTTTFAITFPFLGESTYIKVSIKVDATGVITQKTAATHYNVSGSNVVFTLGNYPATGETVIIELDLPYTQESDYTDNSVFPAETLEENLDLLTLEVQLNKDISDRSIKLDSSIDLGSVSTTVEATALTANYIISVNDNADGFELVSPADVALTGSITGSTGIVAETSSGAYAARTITGTASQIAVTNGNGVSGNPTIGLVATTASRALVSDGSGFPTAAAATTTTEIGYVNGVTSAIQTQLNNKQPLDADLTALATAFTAASASGPASLVFAEDTDNGSNTITIQAPAAVTANVVLTLPDGDGNNLQYLQTNGSGVLTWANGAAGLVDVVDDTTPQLGGNLDVNGRSIVSVSNGDIVIAPNGTGVISVTGGKIKFPASQSASADANTLDDYEEGTFTPTVIGSSSAGTASYTTQTGVYTKVGNVVYVAINLNYNSGNGTGNLQLAGLPFTASSASPALTIGFWSNVAYTATSMPYLLVGGTTTTVDCYQTASGGGAGTNIPYDAAGIIVCSGFYFV